MFRQFIRQFAKSCPPKSKCPKTKSVPRCPEPKNRKLGPSECIVGPSGVYPPHEGGYKLWKNLSLYICLPMIAFVAYNTFCNQDEPEPERPKFIPLEYLRRRTRQFCWGGGGPTDKSFFHNPEVNALSDGYEDEQKKPKG